MATIIAVTDAKALYLLWLHLPLSLGLLRLSLPRLHLLWLGLPWLHLLSQVLRLRSASLLELPWFQQAVEP